MSATINEGPTWTENFRREINDLAEKTKQEPEVLLGQMTDALSFTKSAPQRWYDEQSAPHPKLHPVITGWIAGYKSAIQAQ